MPGLLVLGAHGQLGHDLMSAARARGLDARGLSRGSWPDGLDVTDEGAVKRAVSAAMPAVVVNAAAYTNVDRAEDEPDTAFRVNRDGARYVAEACEASGALLL